MSSANIYQKIVSNPKKIGFGDLFGGAKATHTEQDTDYAMIAGTTLDTVNTELGMLQKWNQPWLYKRILLTGLTISAVVVGAVAVMILMSGWSTIFALNLLVIMIPPCIVPVALMVFFWEMNAPRDISLTKMLGYFAAGGVLSIMFTGILGEFIPIYDAVFAPVTEEPAKLMASLFFLQQIYKKRSKVYGFTGLAIGAAVGAGFAAFESAQYAFNCLATVELDYGLSASMLYMDFDVLLGVLNNVILRNICAICGHVLYCAPYACVAALSMERTGKIADALSNVRFWVVFTLSCISHAVWNFGNYGCLVLLGKLVVITLVLWGAALYGIRNSFQQLTSKIQVYTNPGMAKSKLQIQGIKGVHTGVSFTLTSSEIVIGTDPTCKLTYPIHLTQIAKQHCKLLIQNDVLYLADLGTTSGTYLNGSKLPPLKGYPVKAGDHFTIGGPDQEFRVV